MAWHSLGWGSNCRANVSVTSLLPRGQSQSRTIAAPGSGAGSRRQQSIDGLDPDVAGLLEAQAMVLAHAAPTGPIGQRLERDQRAGARRGAERIELRPVHQLEPGAGQLPHLLDALRQGRWRALHVGHQPPDRQPGLATKGTHPDLIADAGLAAGAQNVAVRHGPLAALQDVIEGGQAEASQRAEALEDQALRAAGALGHFQCGRDPLFFSRDLEIGLDQELAGARGALQPAVPQYVTLFPEHLTVV